MQFEDNDAEDVTKATVTLRFDRERPYESRWVVSDDDGEGSVVVVATFAEDDHSSAQSFAGERAATRWVTCVEIEVDGRRTPIGGPGS